MRQKRRWIAWVLAESANLDAPLPWKRGLRRHRIKRETDAAQV